MAERISRRLVLMSSAAIGAVYLAGYLDTRSADAGLASANTTSLGAVPAGGMASTTTDTAPVAQAQVAAATTANTAPTTAPSTAAPPSATPKPASTALPQQAAAPVRQAAEAPPTATVPVQRAVPPTPRTPTAVPPTATAKPAPTAIPRPTATAVPTGLRDGTYTGVGNSRRGAIQAALTVKDGRITNVAITGASTQYPVSWISQLPPEVVAAQSSQVDLVSGATYSSLAFQGAVRQAIAQAQA